MELYTVFKIFYFQMSVLFGYLKKSSTWLIHRLCSILNFIRSKCNIFKHSSNSARNFIEFNFTQNLPGLRLEFDKMTATKINHPILSSSHCSSHQSSSQVDLIAQHLREAQHSIDIAVFTFSEHRLYNLVLRAYRSGICVRLLTDAGSERTPGSSIPNLRADGVNVRTNATGEGASDRNLLHLKFAGKYFVIFKSEIF